MSVINWAQDSPLIPSRWWHVSQNGMMWWQTVGLRGLLFLHILMTLVISCLFHEGHSDKSEVTSHGGLTCISRMISDVDHPFMWQQAKILAVMEFTFAKALLTISTFHVWKLADIMQINCSAQSPAPSIFNKLRKVSGLIWRAYSRGAQCVCGLGRG